MLRLNPRRRWTRREMRNAASHGMVAPGFPLQLGTVFLVLAALVVSVSVGFAQTPAAVAVIKNGLGPVTFLRFSTDGRELVRICEAGMAELFDTARYKRARTFDATMRTVAYSPDGTLIATAEGTGGARIWDSTVPGEPMPFLPPFVAADRYLLATPLKVLQAPSREATEGVSWVEFSPDGKILITAHGNGQVKVWNTGSWTVDTEAALTDVEVSVAAFHPGGRTVFFGDLNGVLHEWSLERKAETSTTRTVGSVVGIAFSADGKTLVTTHRLASGRAVTVWDAVARIPEVKNGFSSAAFSRDGKVLAVGGNRIELLDPLSRKQIRVIALRELSLGESNPQQFGMLPNANRKVPVSVGALASSPDGHTLAAGLQEGTVRLVDLNR
jgi:WD40 repeat protein